MSEERAFVRATWANVLGNALKIVVEGAIGLSTGSLALVADAAHSLADLLASVAVLIWGRLTYAGPDAGHPHGHERVEAFTALLVGVTLIVLAGNLLYETVGALREGSSVVFSLALLGGLAFAVADMVAVYWYTVRVNERLNSPSLHALAVDCLNDVYTSLAAAVGVFGVALGFPALDAVAGGAVSLLVGYQGYGIVRENLDYLVGSAPDPAERERIQGAILGHPAVEGVHDLRVYYIGPELEVEFHAEVDGSYTLREAHDIETELNEAVRALEGVGDAHVHLDPAGMGEWKDAEE
jgi:cation diffusion facilitator family transporter